MRITKAILGAACAASVWVLSGCGGGGSGPSRNGGNPGGTPTPTPGGGTATVGRVVFSSNRGPFTAPATSNYEIYITDVGDSSNQPTRLTNDVVKFAPRDDQPSLSRDGNRIAFISTRGISSDTRDNDPDLFAFDADGQNVVRLTNDPGNAEITDAAPEYGPNRQIVFVRGGSIFVVRDVDTNSDGLGDEAPRLITSGLDPTFSRDGNRIIFVRAVGTPALTQLFSINLDGTGEVQLTSDNTNKQQPDVAPTGDERITYVSAAPGSTQSAIVVATGNGSSALGAAQIIVPANATNLSPSFTANGREVVFQQGDRTGSNNGIFRTSATPPANGGAFSPQINVSRGASTIDPDAGPNRAQQ